LTQEVDPRAARLPRWPAAAVFFGAGLLSTGGMVLLVGASYAYLLVTGVVLVAALVALVARRTRQRPLAFLLGWFSPHVLLLGFFLWWTGSLGDFFLSHSFDRDEWLAKRAASFDDRTRLRMVEDLRASGRLEGLTREEAATLLGEPDARRWEDDRSWVWRLGPDRGIGIDSSWLLLRFGPEGRVVLHDVVED